MSQINTTDKLNQIQLALSYVAIRSGLNYQYIQNEDTGNSVSEERKEAIWLGVELTQDANLVGEVFHRSRQAVSSLAYDFDKEIRSGKHEKAEQYLNDLETLKTLSRSEA